MLSPSASSDDAAAKAVADINIDALIIEVQSRPVLWDKTHRGYADRIIKSNMWDQVCEKIIENWSELSIVEKQKIGTQIQKKWRNLKDSFAKELAIQKKGKSGQELKKRRPYIHFQALTFLASQPLERETTSNISVDDSEQDSNNSIERENRRQVRKTSQARETDRSEELLDIIRQKKTYDEDISFTEMLVPLLKKLNDDQKHYAKVEILNILNVAKRYRPPEFQGPQTQYRSASEPNRYDRIPCPQDSRRRLSSVMCNYTPSPPSTFESPAYVMSPTLSPSYASSQPLPTPQQAQASTSGNQALGTNMVSIEMNQENFSNEPNHATLLYDDQEMENYTQRNPANIRVSEHTDADIIYSADTASPVVRRGNGIQMKDFLIFKRN